MGKKLGMAGLVVGLGLTLAAGLLVANGSVIRGAGAFVLGLTMMVSGAADYLTTREETERPTPIERQI